MAEPEIPKLPLGGESEAAKGKMPMLSSQKRANSAPKERPPPPPITPRNKKASRSLFKELGGTVKTIKFSKNRVVDTYSIVRATIYSLEKSVESTKKILSDNYRMVASTKETGKKEAEKSGKKEATALAASSPGSSKNPGPPPFKLRPVTDDERVVIGRELRDELEAAGEERDATEEEIDAEVEKRQFDKKTRYEVAQRRSGNCNKGIVGALQALLSSSEKSVIELYAERRKVEQQLEEIDLVIELLGEHLERRDALFDPVKSTDLPFAKRMGTRPIERSVLYQKMNMLPKDPDEPTKPLNINWNDKDEEATEGKINVLNKSGSQHFKDDKGNPGLTAHQATFAAAKCEDASRFCVNTALKVVRAANTTLASRKSALQVAVLESRQLMLKQKRAAKSGKFGSSAERSTDPAGGKGATNPEDAG